MLRLASEQSPSRSTRARAHVSCQAARPPSLSPRARSHASPPTTDVLRLCPHEAGDATLPCGGGVPVPTHARRVSGRSRARAHCPIICPIKRTQPPCIARCRRGDSRRGVVGASAVPPSHTRTPARPFPDRALSHAAFEPCRSLHSSRVSHLLGARMDPRSASGEGPPRPEHECAKTGRGEEEKAWLAPTPTTNPRRICGSVCPSDDVRNRIDDFGGSADPARAVRILVPWLCGPALRLVCPYRVIVRGQRGYLRSCIRANSARDFSA